MSYRESVVLTAELSERCHALYLGIDANGDARFGGTEDHLLALGRARSGKTSGLIIPSVAVHPGPVIVTSTRADVLVATEGARTAVAGAFGGSVVELTFAGSGSGQIPAVRWSVTDGCTDWNVAVDRASVLVGAAIAGPDDMFWAASGSDLLAGCLFGAALLEEDDRMMALRIKSADVAPYLEAVLDHCPDDHQAPYVFNAAMNPDTMAEVTLQSLYAILSAQVLGQFRYETPSADSYLDLNEFVREVGTAYIVIPDARARVLRPLVSAFVEAAAAAWRTTDRTDRANTILLALDEVANVAPLPNLPALITAGGGDGIQCLLGMQDPGQAGRWGAEAPVIVGGTSHIALYPGLNNANYLGDLARLLGQQVTYDVHVQVRDGVPRGERYASEGELIRERLQLEQATADTRPRLKSIAARRAGAKLASRRMRAGVVNREPEEIGATAVLNELAAHTRVTHVPSRQPIFDVGALRAGRTGHFLLVDKSVAEYRRVAHWSQDPLWARLLADR